MLQEFRKFALKSNMLDVAVGVIIGAGFGKVVTSLTQDILMPPIGLLLGRVDFSSLFISLTGRRFASMAEAKAAGAPTINYGLFLNNVLDFFIIAFAVFLLVQAVNRLKRKEAPPVVDTRPCPYCLSAIPKAASRCGHCTSQVERVESVQPQ